MNGTVVELRGSETKEGEATTTTLLTPLKHRKDAQIEPGATFTALVAADTVLAPVD